MPNSWYYFLLFVLIICCIGACRFRPDRLTRQQAIDQGRQLAETRLPQPYQSLKPGFSLKKPPAAGDWLARHPVAPQSFADYKKFRPRRPDSRRSVIYLQPLRMPETRQSSTNLPPSLLEDTADFCRAMTGLTVRLKPVHVIESLPSRARLTTATGAPQVLAPYLLAGILTEKLPKDGLCIIGITVADLSPGAGYPFVYGQSSLRYGVAVVSVARQGDFSATPAKVRSCHLRTVGHELGHLFGLRHCTGYECLMNGAAGRKEADARPFFLCPLCLRKLCWNLDSPPEEYLYALAHFFSRRHMTAEARRAEALLRLLPP